MTKYDEYDKLISHDGPAALVIREPLMPVEGVDGVLFPATYAAGDGFKGGYNIDTDASGHTVCLIDSVGSQANRIEPLFLRKEYSDLVPQIDVQIGDVTVSIFEAGHRAGDALLRCSALQDDLRRAFTDVLAGNAEALAKIAPTSMVFGVWDSRDTQAKLPRVVASTIRAYEVRELTRSAVYIPPIDYSAHEIFSEEDKAKAEGNNKSPLAQRGFVHNPASHAHGGVIADGGIRRDATLSLAALRQLQAGKNLDKTIALQRYILGLALVAFTAPVESYLRQGCVLVRNPDLPREFVEVFASGQRKACQITHESALKYAKEAATAFGVGKSCKASFEKERAKRDVQGDGNDKGKTKRGKRSSANGGEGI